MTDLIQAGPAQAGDLVIGRRYASRDGRWWLLHRVSGYGSLRTVKRTKNSDEVIAWLLAP